MTGSIDIEVREPGRPVRRLSVAGRVELGRECGGENLDDPEVSRRHLALDTVGGHLTVEDLGSSNGTRVNGLNVSGAHVLGDGDVISLGATELVVRLPAPAVPAPPAPVPASVGGARRDQPAAALTGSPAPAAPVRATIALHPNEALYADLAEIGAGDLTDELIRECTWTDANVTAAGIPIVDVPFVSVGGGLGSFAIVDFLRVAGVAKDQITVLTPLEFPHHTYEYLAKASQIRDTDRLRSDSMSRIDNIWGFPGYAIEEAWRRRTPRPLWSVLTEPLLSEYYNPRAIDMYQGVEREARRIGWPDMRVKGQARMVRRRREGGYFAVLTPPPGDGPVRRVAYRAKFVHVAVGYPSLKFLPDLQAYRTTYDDYYRVVNAYEQHDHVYEALRQAPGTVVVRGAGIVSSRILERLLNDHEQLGTQTHIVHLIRTWVDGPRGKRTMRRQGGDGFTYQPFTYPKAAGAGQLRQRTMRLQGKERAAWLKEIGGTTTSKLGVWQRQLARARADGTYRAVVGEVQQVSPTVDGRRRVRTVYRTKDGTVSEIDADFIIDATGLEGDIKDHRLLSDLLSCGGATANESGRLNTDNQFRILGTESGDGCIFASGSVAAGGSLPPADSFWGVEHTAVEICDELARRGFCAHLGFGRSLHGWWRWMRGTPI